MPAGNMPFTDATVSNTTNRNTSRFILLSPIARSDYTPGVNFQPAVRTSDAERGPAFVVTTSDPIALFASGESTI